MSRRDDVALGLRVAGALRTAGLLRPMAPQRLVRGARSAKALHGTAAASAALHAAWDPDGTAILDEGGAVTWRELDARARGLAAVLVSRHGVGPGRALAILARNHRGVLEALAAAGHTGADALLLNTELTAAQLEVVLGRHDVGAVVCDAEFDERLAEACPDLARVPAEELAAVAAGGDPATLAPPSRRSRTIILTSGTTGAPKSAHRDLPPRAMAGPLLAMVHDFGLRRGEPVAVGPPLFHGFGLAFASVALGLGAPVLLQRRFDAERMLRAIAAHRAGCFVGVPVMLQRMVAVDPRVRAACDVSSLRGVVSAGAPLAPAVSERFMDAFGDVLLNAYGSTETGFGAYATPQDLRAAPGTIGRPPVGTTLRILDAQRRPVPQGQVGHLFVGGELVFDGYADGGSKETTDGLMNTGDLGHVDAAGRLFIDGREDDMIVSGGENVFPQEVEDALLGHPGVADAAVVGVDDAEFGQRLRAFVVLGGDRAPTEADLEAWLRSRLERYKLPREFVVCDALPRTATGKVLRRELVADDVAEGAA